MKVLGAAAAAAMTIGVNGAFAADLDPPVVEAPQVAEAQAAEKFGYIALRGGAAWYDDTDFLLAGPTVVSNSYDDSQFFGTIGFGGDLSWGRIEVEVGFFNSSIDTHSTIAAGVVTPFAAQDSFGRVSARTAMVNAFYDFDFGSIKPFVGAGLGYGKVEVENFGVAGLPGLLVDSDTGFAWQLTAGLGYQVMEGLDIELGYRYQSFAGIELVAADGTASDFDYDSHNVFAGVRAAF